MKFRYTVFGIWGACVAQQEPNEVCSLSSAQCGGTNFSGPARCCDLAEECVYFEDYYSQCTKPSAQCVPSRRQCGGEGYSGETDCCDYQDTCEPLSDTYSECTPMNATLYSIDSVEDFGRDACLDILAQGDITPDVNSTGFAHQHGRLHLNTTTMRLHDENNELMYLRGISSQGIPTNCADRGAIRYAVEHWGIEVLRIGMFLDQPAGLTDDPQLEEGWETIVQIAEDLGIYVVLFFANINRGDPYYYLTEEGIAEDGINATAFWQRQATKFADKSHVIFEIAYEPYFASDGPYWNETPAWQRVKDYANVIIPAIREIDPEVIILLPTNWWGQAFHLAYMFPLDESVAYNVMYQFNFWMCAHRLHLSKFDKYASKIPLFVSSWGMGDWLGNAACLQTAKSFIELFDKHQVSWMWRDLVDSSPRTQAMFLADTCVEANSSLNMDVDYDIENSELSCQGIMMKSYFSTGKFPASLDYPEPTCSETWKECSATEDCCHPNTECVAKSSSFNQCVPVEEAAQECVVSEVEVTSGRGFADRGRLLIPDLRNARLRDSDGNSVQLKGVTSFCFSDSQMQTLVDEFGINVFRWKMDVSATGGNINLDQVDEFVQICVDIGIYCVLDWHLDLEYSVADPIVYLREASEFWADLATRYIGVTNLIFELVNVAGGDAFDLRESGNQNNYLRQVMNIVLDIDAERLMMSGTPKWGKAPYIPGIQVAQNGVSSPSLLRSLNIDSKSDMDLFESVKMWGGPASSDKPTTFAESVYWFITEWKVQDEDGFYPENTQRFLDQLNWKNDSFTIDMPELCDVGFNLSAPSSTATLVKSIINTETPLVTLVELSSETLEENSSEDDDDDEDEKTAVIIGAGTVMLVAAVFLVYIGLTAQKKAQTVETKTAVENKEI